MTYEEQVTEHLNHYAQLFDVYMEQAEKPESARLPPPDDPIENYLYKAVTDPLNYGRCRDNMNMREAFKSSTIEFIRNLLESDAYREKVQRTENEIADIDRFLSLTLPQKRSVWQQVVNFILAYYSEQEINLKGYVNQLRSTPEEQFDNIFEALADQWRQCASAHLTLSIQSMLEAHQKNTDDVYRFENMMWDYKRRLQIENTVYRYPQLREIVNLIGRNKLQDKLLKDSTITRYIPTLLAPAVAGEDIDGVRLSNHIPSTLPAELAYLSDPQCEDLFFLHYATHQLQSFSSKPPRITKITEHHKTETPRLIKGPIIVSVDTSCSMQGQPIEIAKSLLLQLVEMARAQHRPCYLITYSVRANAIDLAAYGHQWQLNEFLRSGFSGGTDGNEMLLEAFDVLQSKKYEMADVLIISDFYWACPNSTNMEKLEETKSKRTRFYGLCINGNSKIHTWVDRVWNIQIRK